MGRTEPSVSKPPQSFRRSQRAKDARRTINKLIPTILATNPRARIGVESVELYVDPGADTRSRKTSFGKEAGRGGGGSGGAAGKGKGKRKGKGRRGGADDEDEESEGELGAAQSKSQSGAKGKAKDAASRADKNNDDDDGEGEESAAASPLIIRILLTDTLTAARDLTQRLRSNPKQKPKSLPLLPAPSPNPQPPPSSSNQSASSNSTNLSSSSSSHPAKKLKPRLNPVVILNMASPLRPGGGLLSGAASQEEFLCRRTTLHASLHEAFYRLPDAGLLWTPDVMVFRPPHADPATGAPGMLRRKDRFYVGVVTAGMLRFPEVEGGRYVRGKEAELVLRKVRGVVRVVVGKGARGAVLGAWGCGAYGNPVGEVVRAWKKVLVGEDGGGGGGGSAKAGKVKGGVGGGGWGGGAEPLGQLEEVVFAINQRKMAEEFAKHWGDGIEVERVERVAEGEVAPEPEDEEMEQWKKEMEELEQKIRELEIQRAEAKFPARLDLVLQPLRKQRVELQSRRPQPEEYEIAEQAQDDGSGESTDDGNLRKGEEEEEDDDDEYDQDYSSGELAESH